MRWTLEAIRMILLIYNYQQPYMPDQTQKKQPYMPKQRATQYLKIFIFASAIYIYMFMGEKMFDFWEKLTNILRVLV